jgi:hypothetical protein
MEEAFLTFRKFHDPQLAADMAGKLRANQIPVEIEDSRILFDPSFAHNELERDIRLKLRAADFVQADGILQSFYEEQAERVGKDHYLYQFRDSELLDIVRNPDEWGYLDYALARKILREHGIAIPERTLKRFQNEKMKRLARPEPSDRSRIRLGYALALLMPLLGMLIGLNMCYMKKTLPDGRRFFVYGEADRREGRRIFVVACAFLVLWLLFWIR